MAKSKLCFVSLAFALCSISACKDEAVEPNALNLAPGAAVNAAAQSGFQGQVVETMNSGGYTYAKIKTGDKEVWAAAPETQVEVGDQVSVPDGMPMNNYTSSTLKRTFDVVYFVQSLDVGDAMNAEAAVAGHEGEVIPHPAPSAPATVEIGSVPVAPGGMTIAKTYADRATLVGKQLTVRGRVVKYNSGIMGKNWLHIQDGSGAVGSNDLTITTDAETKVGDLVLATGTVAADKDFGAGYRYDVIVEDAKLTIE